MRATLSFLLVGMAGPLSGQSLLYRPPNLGGTWVPDAGVVQFNFVHRFYVSPGPSHAVVNFPNFTIAAGFPGRVALGAHFATRSLLVGTGNGAQSSNETELFGRWRVYGAEGRPGFGVAVTPAYNLLAKSFDGEVGLDWTRGALTLHGAGRAVSRRLGQSGKSAAAFAGGFNARLNQYVAVSADAGSFVSPTVRAAWSAALNLLIPGSPHTFSLQASNATSASIQGTSEGISSPKNILYGFEFTIPLHLKRFSPWFHKSPKAVTLGAPPGTAVAAEVRMSALKFAGETVPISAGQAVRWTNADPVEHTVTFDGGTEAGSPVIPPNASYIHRFDRPGTYPYHCTPHPFMKGVIVVR
ncbi:MAG TPA: plastocyanin/azurin family copper-binding protein [Gemmatimonadales bacterium]|nr:plastocyanin/azurin family copper-binding protein [Gemmatimonadales bacterium]